MEPPQRSGRLGPRVGLQPTVTSMSPVAGTHAARCGVTEAQGWGAVASCPSWRPGVAQEEEGGRRVELSPQVTFEASLEWGVDLWAGCKSGLGEGSL